MESLPNEIILHIFAEYTPLTSLGRCAQVSKRWRNLFDARALRHYHNAHFSYLRSFFYPVNTYLLRHVDLELADHSGLTPLHQAANDGNREHYDMIMRRTREEFRSDEERMAYVDRRDRNGRTALIHAAFASRVDIAEDLLKEGADVDVRNGRGSTALLVAIDGRDLKMTELLLRNNASFVIGDNYGMTPMHVAAGLDKVGVKLVRLLLDAGADPLPKDNFERLPLHIAASSGDALTFKTILEDAKQKLFRGETALPNPTSRPFWAMRITGENNDDGENPDDDDVLSTELHPACFPDSLGFTPLHRAAESGNVDVLRYILRPSDCETEKEEEKGNVDEERCRIPPVHIDVRNYDGQTPLLLAAMRGDHFCAKELVDAGADVDAEDRKGRAASQFMETMVGSAKFPCESGVRWRQILERDDR